MTRLPLDVGAFRLSPDGKRIVVSQAVFPDAEDPAATKARLDAMKADKSTGVLYDKIFVRHWDAWADGTRNHLFSLTLDADGVAARRAGRADARLRRRRAPTSPSATTPTSPSRPMGRPWSSPPAWPARASPGAPTSTCGARPSTARRRPGTSPPTTPPGTRSRCSRPTGATLAWRAQKRPGFESDRFGVWVMDLKTGARREVDPAWDRSAAPGWAGLATAARCWSPPRTSARRGCFPWTPGTGR